VGCSKPAAACRAIKSRTLFGIDDGKLVLLHGFIKTTQKTPKADLDLARNRWREWKSQKAKK
jgi:phage-related protein